MQHLTMEDVKGLAKFSGNPCVSIYLPTQRQAGFSIKQDARRLRHCLDWAHERAIALEGRDSKALAVFFKKCEELASESSFWQERAEGLALFLAPNFSRVFHLPEDFVESVSVDRHFNVTPLVKVAQKFPMLVLTISQNHVQLWEVDNQLAKPVEVKNMPANLAEVQRFKESEKLENRHVAGGPGSYHGEGDDSRTARVELVEFVQAVDKALVAQYKDSRLSLALLGAEPTVGTYRQHSRYPQLVPDVIRCNPEIVKAQEICREAKTILDKLGSVGLSQTKSRYTNLEATEPNKVNTDPAEILKAARQGKVESMLVAYGAGYMPSEVFREHLGGEDVLSDVSEDLVNTAVRETLLRGGLVYPVAQEGFPVDSAVAAIMRY
jgi:hypothetical protein